MKNLREYSQFSYEIQILTTNGQTPMKNVLERFKILTGSNQKQFS